ncbi:MAG: biotin--[acetyl-CoA-carboxylase] ligase [Jatrophihabitantaceae bacterium]
MQRAALDVSALQTALGERWARIRVVEQTESTNADLVADSVAPDRSVLVAEDQRTGRGRLDRRWSSPPRAGLTFSVLLRPSVPLAAWGWLPLLTGVALRAGVSATTGLEPSLKWPNDLLIGAAEAKVAGILAQTSGDGVVIGIGLNVTTTAEELPAGVNATSLALAGAGSLDRTVLLIAILQRLDAQVAQWEDVGGDAEACGLAAAYRAACSSITREVIVTVTDGASITGRVLDVDSTGRLRLGTSDGERTVGAGDVQHLRRL